MTTKPLFDKLIQELSLQRGAASSKNLGAALRYFGNPNLSFSSIHVVGTNGKGSVSCKVAKGLELQGEKVGLFTSPHIVTFCERIQINGKNIEENAIEEHLQAIAPFSLTFFESAFLVACLYFRKQGINRAVIEAGIGGRLDTTNCLTSDCSVITSIGYDHQKMLGDTLEKIAWEKSGIIKPGHTVFLGPSAKYPCMYSEQWKTVEIAKQADFELDNRAVADAVLLHLDTPESVRKRALEACLPCRFEKKGNWIFDIAHNTSGIEALLKRLPEKSTFYVGFSRSKDIAGCLQLLEPRSHSIVLLPHNRVDLEPQEELARYLTECIQPETIEDVLEIHKKQTPPHVVCGSAYIMEPLRDILLSL